MRVKTWLQRLTDESNSWFSAVKAEDDRDFLAAAFNYIEDATRCLEQNLVRAALSCTCAANCLMQLGSEIHAHKLYWIAARMYMDNAGVAMSESIREALWSMKEASENFLLAGDRKEAEVARKKYTSLAARTSPFGRLSLDIPTVEEKRHENKSTTASTVNQPPLPQGLLNQIDRLMKLHRKLSAPSDKFDPGYILRSVDPNGGSKLNEKSIAS